MKTKLLVTTILIMSINYLFAQSLIGKWCLDSLKYTGTDENTKFMKENIGSFKNAKLIKDGGILFYSQREYKKEGDDVLIEEFKTNGKYTETHIYDYSVKNESSGKQVSTYDYIIQEKNIISILKWGAEKQYETKSKFSILKLESRNLTYKFIHDNQIDTYYFTKCE